MIKDIIEVVSESVKLEKRGKRHIGLCPFHSEKTPSFVVSSEAQEFFCFGCGAAGDLSDFIEMMSKEKV